MRTRPGGDRRCRRYDRRVGDSSEQERLHQGAVFLQDDQETPERPSNEGQTRVAGNPEFVAEAEGLIDAVERVQGDLGHYMTMPEDATRIAVETIATALSWWRDRTLETWKPAWIYLGSPKPRLIGVGWRGMLLIWSEPIHDRWFGSHVEDTLPGPFIEQGHFWTLPVGVGWKGEPGKEPKEVQQ